MEIKEAYDIWSTQYDSDPNKTRDLEAYALRTSMAKINFDSCLELGCGTGKNTEWLASRARYITAVDFSEQMLSKARQRPGLEGVDFQIADINSDWTFITRQYDLISFSLVLEHIEHLDPIFKQVEQFLMPGGLVYIGELHPSKQYAGSKARFDHKNGQEPLTCFTHHLSDFLESAGKFGFQIIDLNEYFDNGDKRNIPRVLSLIFQKDNNIRHFTGIHQK
jgi:predicted TPR repeat methyltransferase